MRGVVITVGQHQPSGVERVLAFVVRWLITAAAVWVAAQIVVGIRLEGWVTTLVVALVLGLLNAYLKPLLVFGTFPLLIMTVGLSLILINTALLALTAWIVGTFTEDFRVDGFWSAFWGAVLISIVSFAITRVINPSRVAESVARRSRR